MIEIKFTYRSINNCKFNFELLFFKLSFDNFHLNSDVLKNLLKKDKDYWVQEKQKTFMRLWKLANEFSLKAISPANYNGKESSDNE